MGVHLRRFFAFLCPRCHEKYVWFNRALRILKVFFIGSVGEKATICEWSRLYVKQ